MTEWVDVGSRADLTKARNKLVVDVHGTDVLVLAHGDGLYALANICIHRDRELSKGVVLNGKLVCPGHQWAFALDTGYEAVKDECQPTFPIREVGDRIEVGIEPNTGGVPVTARVADAGDTDHDG